MDGSGARRQSLYDSIIGPWGSTELFGVSNLPSYQVRDHEVIDYELFPLPGTPHELRGPPPETLEPGRYFTCVGAAQTFGCFCPQPYPALLAACLDVPALNLGLAGAGPRLFLQDDELLRYVNESRFAVVQILSGRSEENSLFSNEGRGLLTRRSDGQDIRPEPAYRELLANESPGTVQAIVAETRANWTGNFRRLLEAIEVPTILFWFSQRAPDYEPGYSDVASLFGQYPQLVNRAMVEELRGVSDEYVECVSARGIPQRLVSRFTGEPRGVNAYYPSPEMHLDATDALVEACRRHAY